MNVTEYWRRKSTDPIRGLTLERLARQIDAYDNGVLAEFALTAEAMENRDDILKNVITKRKKAVTRHGWEILTVDNSPAASRQRAALDYFYRHLTCSHALRKNQTGGFQLLAYQMMDAIAKGYAVHEIAWRPVINPPGTSSTPAPLSSNSNASSLQEAVQTSSLDQRTSLTAHFQFVPLWYFEATSGGLRILSSPDEPAGQPLADRQWLVTIGDALMIACARAFIFKHQPLQAWLDYTRQFGFPGLRGITSATRGSPEFTDMEKALATFMKELSVVTNNSESIDVLDLKGHGPSPFADLVERMDRVMAALWRGADLSTISRDRGYGASLQEQESRLLEEDDARTLSEHLNATVDRWVLQILFGPDSEPLARIKVLVTPQERTSHDLAIDQFLVAHGARLSITETLERYGRAEAQPGEQYLSPRTETRTSPENSPHQTPYPNQTSNQKAAPVIPNGLHRISFLNEKVTD